MAARAGLLTLQSSGLPGRLRLAVDEKACFGDGVLYGGSVVAGLIDTAEDASSMPVAWISTQFLASASLGESVLLEIDLEVRRSRLAQFRGAATRDDGLVIARCLGAAAVRGGRPEVWGLVRPDVPRPEDCPPLGDFLEPATSPRWLPRVEERVALGPIRRAAVGNPAEGGRTAIWYRIPGLALGDAASQALASDLVLTAIMAAGGFESRGFSLDNTYRVIDEEETEWLLLELLGQSFDGVGHGEVRVWHPEGRLLGLHQETAILRPPAASG